MKRARAREAHVIPDRPALSISVGDVVQVGKRDTEWPAFVLVTTGSGSGWVPSRFLSADADVATVTEPYNTQELATVEGQMLTVLARDDESGWLWCRSDDGSEGWVPTRTLDEIAIGEIDESPSS